MHHAVHVVFFFKQDKITFIYLANTRQKQAFELQVQHDV